jgi:hypothetical protein
MLYQGIRALENQEVKVALNTGVDIGQLTNAVKGLNGDFTTQTWTLVGHDNFGVNLAWTTAGQNDLDSAKMVFLPWTAIAGLIPIGNTATGGMRTRGAA